MAFVTLPFAIGHVTWHLNTTVNWHGKGANEHLITGITKFRDPLVFEKFNNCLMLHGMVCYFNKHG